MKIRLVIAALCLFCSSLQAQVIAPEVPRSCVFAGQEINFDRDDLYERMDRELLAFTYMHSTSIQILKRSARVYAEVEPILAKNGVPDDLKYLMTIESNLDPTAVSVAKAAGLWQFTKATAQMYGLEVNSEVDERYNTEKATEAACAFLKKAYAEYGDWMTVAASYNAGRAGISDRVLKQRRTSALDLWMPKETMRYMFRILAAKMMILDPASFGFPNVEPYPVREPSEVVTVTGPVPSLVDFAEEHGVSYASLKRANLWLRDSKLTNKEGRTYKIRIFSE